jgi:hypothetical protein
MPDRDDYAERELGKQRALGPVMNPVEWYLELRTRQAGRQIAEDAAVYLRQIEDGITGAASDAVGEIERYLAIAAEMGDGE